MLNLIRSDLYQLIRSKMIYVALTLLVAYFGINTWSLSGWEQPNNIAQIKHELAAQQADPSIDDTWTNDDLYGYQTRTFESYTGSNIMGIAPGGLLSMMLCTLTALFCYQDFRAGFIKNQLSAYAGHRVHGRRTPSGRGAYYAAKLTTIALVNSVFLLLTMGLAATSYAICGFTVRNPEPFWQIIIWALLTWLILCGYTFATAAITWAVRNQAVSVVMALLLGSQALEAMIQLALSAGAQFFPQTGIAAALDATTTWLPTTSTNILLGGAPVLFGRTGSGLWEATAQALSLTAHPLTHVIVTALGFLALGLAVVFLGCRRRDVA